MLPPRSMEHKYDGTAAFKTTDWDLILLVHISTNDSPKGNALCITWTSEPLERTWRIWGSASFHSPIWWEKLERKGEYNRTCVQKWVFIIYIWLLISITIALISWALLTFHLLDHLNRHVLRLVRMPKELEPPRSWENRHSIQKGPLPRSVKWPRAAFFVGPPAAGRIKQEKVILQIAWEIH